MTRWQEASQVSLDAGGSDAAAPPPANPLPFEPSGPQIRPWMRWMARTIDYMLIGFLLGFVPAVNSKAILGLYMLAALVSVVGDSIMLPLWGATPGKALLGIRVVKPDRMRLTSTEALRRSINVWFRGTGMALPVVSIFTMMHADKWLTRLGITTWDKQTGSLVIHKDPGAVRTTIIAVLLVATMVIQILSSFQSQP